MSLELQDKRDHDKELLDEVKNIKTAINKSAVIFGQLEVKIDNLEARVSKIEQKLDK
jgi:predicted  nucleic acid-binding Zn-ribbon protein